MRNLAEEIRLTNVPDGAAAIWWLGQQSFIIKGGGVTVGFDLFLTNYPGDAPRNFPPPLSPDTLDMLDLVFCSHEHSDHLDPWTLGAIAAASPETLFVMPRLCVSLVAAVLPDARVKGSLADEPFHLKSAAIIPIPAAHDKLEAAGQGYRAQGFIVKLGAVTVCHLGDTVMYDGLEERIREHQVDLLLAPINGLDYFRTRRGCIGNIGFREAADLAASAGVKLLIPAHWDLFPGNTEQPENVFNYLAQAHPEQPCHYMARGERFVYLAV